MPSSNYDVVIVGGGIVGVSIGLSLLNHSPSLSVVVLEKEKASGAHSSGRNSGVLHAGFYYSPDSLKAKFCREGNEQIKKLCKDDGLPLLECGKVVVSQDAQEDEQIDLLFDRGQKNGVKLEVLAANDLKKIEPFTQTFNRFLWSPNTAVGDPIKVLQSLINRFLRKGGEYRFNSKVSLQLKENRIQVDDKFLKARHYVNSAGAQSDILAKHIGLAKNYAMIPFAGLYRTCKEEVLPIRRLIYPVPHKINPFLGVHFTKTVSGLVKIGPTAIPIFGREQYKWSNGWSVSDLKESLKGGLAVARGDAHKLSSMIASEWPKFLQSQLIKQATRLVPEAANVTRWAKKPPGIRAQLVDLSTGKLEQDFVIESFFNSTHVLNAVSPGWTSAIPFGDYVANKYVLPSLG
jgi:L-2-hydroxyglutarate oxidase LhgO